MKRRTVLTALSAVAAAGVLGSLVFAAIAWQTEIPAIAPPKLADFDPAIIRRGAALAAIGDCVVCHTATQGPAFAGGRALETPFGTLYATNITPDERTGIGNWSADAFRRAMRDGVSRDGEHLYPALPYEHFTRVTDADLDAIYAFLMTRAPVPKETPENRLIPPLGFRPLLAGWKLLFLHDDPVLPVAGQSDEWNRGRYLVEGFGHCGGCHTPRNIAGGEERGKPFAGGIAEGWDAPPTAPPIPGRSMRSTAISAPEWMRSTASPTVRWDRSPTGFPALRKTTSVRSPSMSPPCWSATGGNRTACRRWTGKRMPRASTPKEPPCSPVPAPHAMGRERR